MNAEQAQMLREPFPPEMVGKLPRLNCKDCSNAKPQGHCDRHKKTRCEECQNYISEAHIHLDFVGHAAVTDRLIKVDPGWTWEPMAYGPNGEPLVTNGGLWIWLTVADVRRPGFGDATGSGGAKELIGDAIRNAAMRFGVALDLWAKQDLHDSAGPKEADPVPSPSSFQAPAPREGEGTAYEKPSKQQYAKLNATFGELEKKYPSTNGQKSWKEDAQAWTYEQFGVQSAADLTKEQMTKLIDHVVKAGEAREVSV